jgi:Tol biopolymer transport system component
MVSINQYINKFKRFRINTILMCIIAYSLLLINVEAQYFGRNKPGYKNIRFDVVQTPHFEIYNYLKNDSLTKVLSTWTEDWYDVHQVLFKDTFRIKNPVIFYNNLPDFQQTNTISSLIGTGTGGVTESMKNRVIMPVATSLSQTDHTLGHELVHAFQYHLFLNPDSQKRFSLNNVPLWMIEGMAEYLSLGSIDPHTSMWMRDAVLNKDFPTLKQLSTDSRYFPYRYGQAFWAFIGKTWGDSIIVPLLESTAQFGFDKAAEQVIGYNEKTLSGMWKSAMDIYYGQFIKNETDKPAGRQIISEINGGRMNISPSISPDGKYLAFFSEKNLFTLDLYLADASTGKIIRKLSSIVKDNEVDDFSFIESAGTWSPDGKTFAFVIFSKGVNKLAFLDISKSRITREFKIPGVASFSNPAWSPDGSRIVVTGQVDGISDLYLYYIETGEVKQLTDDFTSNLFPAWSSDGKFIVYSQEKQSNEINGRKFSFDLAILDMKNLKTREFDVFDGAYNMNPCFSSDDKYIYFLSDADGYRNLFKYDPENDKVYRLTEYMTGISGITSFSPALSISSDQKTIAYNYYLNNKYNIWTASESEFNSVLIDKHSLDYSAAILPPAKHISVNLVDTILHSRIETSTLPVDLIKEVPFKSKFKLDYISNNATIGVSTGIIRNNMGGSVNAIFSDIVGNNQLYTSLALNGEVYDFGGQVAYINQRGKIKWGGIISHIPYLYGNMFITDDSIDFQDSKIPVINLIIDYMRMFEDNISFFASYPISQTRRFESTASSSWYYYRIDRFNNYYLPEGIGLGGTREKIPAPKGNFYQQISLAYVEDNSYFGMTAPMQGHRSRFQADKYFGSADIFTALVDIRKYFYIKPVTLAFRFYNFGMFGKDVNDGVIPPLYIGYPWLIRGYENISYDNSTLNSNTFNISRLSGTRIMVANAELRFPFSGPERLALINSKLLLTDINLFFDSGVAWNNENKLTLDMQQEGIENISRSPVFSTGVSVRVNVLGYLVLEPYLAFPFQNGGFRNGQFGLNFIPGW